jgi:hypothetical protein
MDNFKITLIHGKLEKIEYNGVRTTIESLLGTPIWDKANNVITISDLRKQITGYGINAVVAEWNYDSFVAEQKKSILIAPKKIKGGIR